MNLSMAFLSFVFSIVGTICTLLIILGQYKFKIDNTVKDVDKINGKFEIMIERIAKLEVGLERDREHNRFVQSRSPLTLTDEGRIALLESSGKNYIDQYKDDLISLIKTQNPKTAYGVQELSQKVIEERSNDDSFNPIKNFVFSKGLKLKILIEIMGIYLRDIALKELGFDISDLP